MIEGQIPEKLLPPAETQAQALTRLPIPGVLASVDKPAKDSKSHKLAMTSLCLSLGIVALVASALGAAIVLGRQVNWSDAAVFVAAIAAAAAPAAGVAASQRASDSKVRAEALKHGGA